MLLWILWINSWPWFFNSKFWSASNVSNWVNDLDWQNKNINNLYQN